jgi:pimeloyl-ACP methyl ester carboxylesterase
MLIPSKPQLWHRSIEFISEGATLRGFLLSPVESFRPLPTIILVLGAGQVLANGDAGHLALPLVDGGFRVLVYDHRGFGESGGNRRQEINPW